MRKWLPLVAISLSTFMLLVDLTIVTIALPAMASGLHSSFAALQWTIDIYVLVLAALLLAAGSVSDLLGRRRVFLAGLLLFAVASLGCGLATDPGVLIAARGVQGIGAAAMYATNAALLGTTYTGRDRALAFGVWGAVNGAAAAAGPILGGVLTEHVGWRAIFLVNIPFAVLAVLIAVRSIVESRAAGGRMDLPGAGLFTLAVTLLVYGLIRAGEHGWTDRGAIAAFVASALALLVFLLVESRRADPMIDLRLFRRPSFTALMVGGAVLTASAFANLMFVSLWAQSVLGLEPVAAGLVLTPLAAVSFVVAGAGGRLLHGVAPQWAIGVGLLLVGVGTLLCMLIGPNSTWTALIPGLSVTGIGVGLASPVLASAALSAAPPERAGMANGAMNTFRQLGFAVAVPIFASVAAGQARPVLVDSGLFGDPGQAAIRLTGGGSEALLAQAPTAVRAAVEHALRSGYAAGLDRIFLFSGIAALVVGAAVLLLVRAPARPDPEPTGRPVAASAPGA
ncbi:MFS transporter [Micromonospora sp. CPCC 205539]|uniref:MFS transporter n=1 Tax=Micromonospora sp. CPCC 205539 TaxID=3122408 RepID=UPI002FF3A3F2